MVHGHQHHQLQAAAPGHMEMPRKTLMLLPFLSLFTPLRGDAGAGQGPGLFAVIYGLLFTVNANAVQKQDPVSKDAVYCIGKLLVETFWLLFVVPLCFIKQFPPCMLSCMYVPMRLKLPQRLYVVCSCCTTYQCRLKPPQTVKTQGDGWFVGLIAKSKAFRALLCAPQLGDAICGCPGDAAVLAGKDFPFQLLLPSGEIKRRGDWISWWN